jgi:hypothetical protein
LPWEAEKLIKTCQNSWSITKDFYTIGLLFAHNWEIWPKSVAIIWQTNTKSQWLSDSFNLGQQSRMKSKQ